MKYTTIALFVAASFCASCGSSEKRSQENQTKQVILKLDDIEQPPCPDDSIGDRWQRVDAYLASKGVKASYGIIGSSLENECRPYFEWIKNRAATQRVEFWHHGYLSKPIHDTLGENMASYAIQLYSFERTYELAKTKLGLDLSTWGPHWSEVNSTTDSALAQCPFIKMTFGRPNPANLYQGKVIAYSPVKMEYPVHNPNFKEFKRCFEQNPPTRLFYLQGHPMSWEQDRWINFTQIIDFMLDQGYEFVLPKEVIEAEKNP